MAEAVQISIDGKELFLSKGQNHKRAGNARALFSQDATQRHSF